MYRLVPYRRCTNQFKQHNSQNKISLPLNFSTTTVESPPNRPAPPPIKVLPSESAGRGVFATRRIGSGELIHTAKPIVSHPYLSKVHDVCYFCLKLIGENAVFSSNDVSSCSEKCREQAKGFYEIEKQANWSDFDDHCRLRGLKYPLLVKRLACMVISGAASGDCVDVLQPEQLSFRMISEMEEEFLLLKSALENAKIKAEKITFLINLWYIKVLARIRINSFRIELAGGLYEDLLSSAAASVENEDAVGNAVYILPSFYNHDCGKFLIYLPQQDHSCGKSPIKFVAKYEITDPNVHILWIENADARIKALRDIEPGEELRICYIDASMDFNARQEILWQGFGFQCTCLRCSSKD